MNAQQIQRIKDVYASKLKSKSIFWVQFKSGHMSTSPEELMEEKVLSSRDKATWCGHRDSDQLHHAAEDRRLLPRRMLIQADHWHPGRPITISVSLTTMPKISWLLNETKPLKDLAGSLAASWLESQLWCQTHTQDLKKISLLMDVNHRQNTGGRPIVIPTSVLKINLFRLQRSSVSCMVKIKRGTGWTGLLFCAAPLKRQPLAHMQMFWPREKHANTHYCFFHSRKTTLSSLKDSITVQMCLWKINYCHLPRKSAKKKHSNHAFVHATLSLLTIACSFYFAFFLSC